MEPKREHGDDRFWQLVPLFGSDHRSHDAIDTIDGGDLESPYEIARRQWIMGYCRARIGVDAPGSARNGRNLHIKLEGW